LICVVERAVDILSVEKSGTFRGKFHVLGGKISPLDGVEPEDLRIAELEKRLTHEPIKEVSSLSHGCGRRCHELLSGEAAGAIWLEDFPHCVRFARREWIGICR